MLACAGHARARSRHPRQTLLRDQVPSETLTGKCQELSAVSFVVRLGEKWHEYTFVLRCER